MRRQVNLGSLGSQSAQVLERLKASDHAALVVFFRARTPGSAMFGLGGHPPGGFCFFFTPFFSPKKHEKNMEMETWYPISHDILSSFSKHDERIHGGGIAWDMFHWILADHCIKLFSSLGHVWISRQPPVILR